MKMNLNCSILQGILLLTIFVSLVFTIPTDKSDHHRRILRKHLSDEEHYKNGQHNRDFDHEAFLGSEDEANEFNQLTPEQTKERFLAIVERIDVNHDGNVTETELKNWINQSQKRYIFEDVDRQWHAHTDGDESVKKLSWEKYRDKAYGFLDEFKSPTRSPDYMKTYLDMLKHDERRWKTADIDGDNALNKDEFVLFLHPEESERMHEVVVEETLEDIDRDGDGKVSESEYIADMYAPEDEQSQLVPEWVKREREQFKTYRDQNKDGFLDRHEIKEWIVPTNYDHAEAEAKHLLYEADSNKDGVLNIDEMLDHYDVFVGSQVGEELARHDEF